MCCVGHWTKIDAGTKVHGTVPGRLCLGSGPSLSNCLKSVSGTTAVAFGCLLDDMLNLIEGNSADQAQRIQAVKLTQLAQDCMQTNVASRPCFNAICQQLASMQ